MPSGQPAEKNGRVVLLQEGIPTRIAEKDRLLSDTIEVLERDDWVRGEDALRVRMAIDEALTNAMVHGNHMDAAKRVTVEVFAENDRWGIAIEDEGSGFAADALPDPDDPENLLREGGRGVIMMRGFMDEVRFLGRRNRVVMTRGRRSG